MDKLNINKYDLPDGWTILAGKTDLDNDLLSTRIARQNDLWFHVRGMPGSHVVLQSAAGERPDKSLIRTAAAVAAWHSKARNGGKVAVSYTEAKYVSKSPRSRPGTVMIRHERVIQVKPCLPEAGEE
ncbi:DUF814 domain-containing protein [bacterium]|nr:DUF814 domain-containing protein [bacterium]